MSNNHCTTGICVPTACLNGAFLGCARAGLYKQLAELKALVAEYREDPAKNASLKAREHAGSPCSPATDASPWCQQCLQEVTSGA